MASSTVVKILLIPSHSPEKKDFSPPQMLWARLVMAFHIPEKKSLIPFQQATATSFTLFHKSIQNCRNPSQLFQSKIKAATRAAIAAMIRPMGLASMTALKAANAPFTTPITAPSLENTVMMVPMAVMTFPITIKTGPTAAATSPMVIIILRVPSSIPFNLSTRPCIKETNCLITGISVSPKEMASSCN